VLLADCVDCATFYNLTTDTDTVTPVALSVKAKSAIQRLWMKTTSPTCNRPSHPRAKLLRQCRCLILTSGIPMAPSSSRSATQSLNYIGRCYRDTLPISSPYFKKKQRTSKSRREFRTRPSPSIASARRRQTTLRHFWT
jgi:hypothetical protein